MSEQSPPLTRAQLRELPLELTEEQYALVQEVVTQLNETSPQARRQIEALVYHCGDDLVAQTLQEALQIEDEGGMLVADGKRRRTPGGVFFYLITHRITSEQLRKTIRLYQNPPEKKKKSGKKSASSSRKAAAAKTSVSVPTPEWDVYYEVMPELSARQGVATTVKITLIGRPGNVKIQQDTVITSFEHTVKTSGLPKGVPTPPTAPTLYTVYIGLKQWRKVENAIKSPEDALIIEGVCAFDAKVNGMVVFASNVTSKTLEAARRQAKSESPSPAASSANASSSSRTASSTSHQTAPVETPAPPTMSTLQQRYPVPPGVPADVAQKLVDLYSAADQFRHKLAAMDALPPDQRLAYGMTQKLLKNTEDQIASIERKYKA